MPDWSLRTIRNFPYSTANVPDYELLQCHLTEHVLDGNRANIRIGHNDFVRGVCSAAACVNVPLMTVTA